MKDYKLTEEGYCWISMDKVRYSRMFLSYIWIWSIMVLIVLIYFALRSKNRLTFEMMASKTWKQNHAMVYSLYINLAFYPLTFIIAFLPGTLNRVLELFNIVWDPLLVIQDIFLPAKGIADVIVFALANYVLRRQLFGFFYGRIQNDETPGNLPNPKRFGLTLNFSEDTSDED